MDNESIKRAAITTHGLSKLAIKYFAERSRERIAQGRASVFDYFNVAFEQATPEERSKMLDAMAKIYEEGWIG